MGAGRVLLALLVVALLPGNVVLALAMSGAVRLPQAEPRKATAKESAVSKEASARAAEMYREDGEALGHEVSISRATGAPPGGVSQPPAAVPAAAESVGRIAALYDAMPTEQAAGALQALPAEEAVEILNQMEERKAGRALAAMPAEKVAMLTRLMKEGMQR
jgi:flagellar motility protein MotE (MotC chaperone)